jgi:cytochrome c oxidase subunit III
MDIPYTTEVRPDTGLTTPKLGIWLFLASEVMLFGSVFASYVLLRVGAQTWPDQSAVLNVPLATLNTLLLIASSVTIVLAWVALNNGNLPRYRRFMGLTLLGGAGFLVLKAFEYSDKLQHGFLPSTSIFYALYFTMTGLHAFHVIAGMIVNAYLCGPGASMWTTQPARFTNRVEIAGMYWHFVDVVWIFLFLVLYVL